MPYWAMLLVKKKKTNNKLKNIQEFIKYWEIESSWDLEGLPEQTT